MTKINGTYTVPPWPSAVPASPVISSRLMVEWMLVLLLTIVVITLVIECCCVPLCFCDNYCLYRYLPHYRSQRYLPYNFARELESYFQLNGQPLPRRQVLWPLAPSTTRQDGSHQTASTRTNGSLSLEKSLSSETQKTSLNQVKALLTRNQPATGKVNQARQVFADKSPLGGNQLQQVPPLTTKLPANSSEHRQVVK